MQQGPSALLLTNWTPKTVESARSHLIPMVMHAGSARQTVAEIQQALSGTRQNPTMMESSPTPMSGSRRFPSLVEESSSFGSHPNPPSGSRLNPTVIEECPTPIGEDECDQWFPLALEQRNDN